MADPTARTFSFHSDGAPADSLLPVKVDGTERMSRPYSFELELVSKKGDLDFEAALSRPARLTITRRVAVPGTNLYAVRTRRIGGRVNRFELVDRRADLFVYVAELVPRLWKLSLTQRNRVFIGKSAPMLIRELMKEAGLATEDFEVRTSRQYANREYIVQYEESNLDFLHRWLEHEGIFYYFESTDAGEKAIFADSVEQYGSLKDISPVKFRANPEGQTWAASEEEAVRSLTLKRTMIPKKVWLKDYNWRNPNMDLLVGAEVSAKGEGDVYEYNNHYRSKEEGELLAKVRAQEILAREKTFAGTSSVATFATGHTWKLAEHFRPDHNISHVLVEVTHHGTQSAIPDSGNQAGATYANEFRTIPADRAYRPPRETPWPAIKGVMHGKIDATGPGLYAELDKMGRYKVKLPMDDAAHLDGKASRWIRMAQPYAGSDHGMHFPLHKGTEVIITHLDGDPDRPIITGAVPDPSTGNVVSSSNPMIAAVKTAGGNEVSMNDEKGHERILIAAGSNKSGLIIGSGSDERADLWTPSFGMCGGIFGSVAALASTTTYSFGCNTIIIGNGYVAMLILAMKTVMEYFKQANKMAVENYTEWKDDHEYWADEKAKWEREGTYTPPAEPVSTGDLVQAPPPQTTTQQRTGQRSPQEQQQYLRDNPEPQEPGKGVGLQPAFGSMVNASIELVSGILTTAIIANLLKYRMVNAATLVGKRLPDLTLPTAPKKIPTTRMEKLKDWMASVGSTIKGAGVSVFDFLTSNAGISHFGTVLWRSKDGGGMRTSKYGDSLVIVAEDGRIMMDAKKAFDVRGEYCFLDANEAIELHAKMSSLALNDELVLLRLDNALPVHLTMEPGKATLFAKRTEMTCEIPAMREEGLNTFVAVELGATGGKVTASANGEIALQAGPLPLSAQISLKPTDSVTIKYLSPSGENSVVMDPTGIKLTSATGSISLTAPIIELDGQVKTTVKGAAVSISGEGGGVSIKGLPQAELNAVKSLP